MPRGIRRTLGRVWEAAKDRVKDEATRPSNAVALGGGALLANAARDLWKSRGLGAARKEVKERLKNSPHAVDAAEYVGEAGRAHASGVKELYRAMRDQGEGRLRSGVTSGVAGLQGGFRGGNAFAVPTKSGPGVVGTTKKMDQAVLEHELGHLKDVDELGGKDAFWKEYARPLQAISRRQYDKGTMAMERNAWKHVPRKLVYRGDETGKTLVDVENAERAALGTYDKGFHRGRSMVGGFYGAKLLAKAWKMRAEENASRAAAKRLAKRKKTSGPSPRLMEMDDVETKASRPLNL